jgi:hypothetical protein
MVGPRGQKEEHDMFALDNATLARASTTPTTSRNERMQWASPAKQRSPWHAGQTPRIWQ